MRWVGVRCVINPPPGYTNMTSIDIYAGPKIMTRSCAGTEEFKRAKTITHCKLFFVSWKCCCYSYYYNPLQSNAIYLIYIRIQGHVTRFTLVYVWKSVEIYIQQLRLNFLIDLWCLFLNFYTYCQYAFKCLGGRSLTNFSNIWLLMSMDRKLWCEKACGCWSSFNSTWVIGKIQLTANPDTKFWGYLHKELLSKA